MNKVQLHGFVGKDPEIKTPESGKKIAKFSFATSENYKDSQGERQTKTEWHSLVFWDKLAEICERYVKKGSELIVEGKISYRDYTNKEGVKKYYTEIICYLIEFCGSQKNSEQTTTVDEKLNDKQGEWQGKKEVKSMSDINELPGENDETDLPF